MAGGAVAFVGGEAVGRVEAVEGAHEGVARHLGEDAGRGNAGAEAVATDHRGLGDAEAIHREAVDQGVHGPVPAAPVPHARQGPAHCQPDGRADAQLVDAAGGHPRQADGERPGADGHHQLLASLGAQPLGVIQAGGRVVEVKDHGGGDDGAGQGPDANLVDAGDLGDALSPQCFLRRP